MKRCCKLFPHQSLKIFPSGQSCTVGCVVFKASVLRGDSGSRPVIVEPGAFVLGLYFVLWALFFFEIVVVGFVLASEQ